MYEKRKIEGEEKMQCFDYYLHRSFARDVWKYYLYFAWRKFGFFQVLHAYFYLETTKTIIFLLKLENSCGKQTSSLSVMIIVWEKFQYFAYIMCWINYFIICIPLIKIYTHANTDRVTIYQNHGTCIIMSKS